MTFQRGDIVLIPFPFTDLTATKTRPAVVVSSDTYQNHRSELLLAYVSSQITKANSSVDHVLLDWKTAGLPKPSFVRPKIAAIEPDLVVYQVGKLSIRDVTEVDRCLRHAMALNETALSDILAEVDFAKQPVGIVEALAHKAVIALAFLMEINEPGR